MSDFEEISVTLADGYKAYARFWTSAAADGAVLFLHGIQSHCGWYEASARHLVSKGLAVLQVDRRGSGRNEVERGHAESADQLIADALAARDALHERTQVSRYHMVGVSWGGKLAVATYMARPEGIASLSLVTPGLFPQVGVSRSMMQEIGFAMLYEPLRRFPIPLNEPELFTADPKWQAFFRTDPFTLRECTAGFYLASRRMDRPIAKLADQQPVPIHLMLVEKEHIIDNAKTEAFARELGWPTVTVRTYANSLHSLEFEPPRDQYLADLVAFIMDAERRPS